MCLETLHSCLACLRRFIDRRGKPSSIWCDHGLSFVGANWVLKELYPFSLKKRKKPSLTFAQLNITWYFIPERVPTLEGLWDERFSGDHLRFFVLGVQRPQITQLRTIKWIALCPPRTWKLRNKEDTSKIYSLNPFVDDDQGMLRVGGRQQRARFSYNSRHPIILNSRHPLTKLLIRHIHLLHGGSLLDMGIFWNFVVSRYGASSGASNSGTQLLSFFMYHISRKLFLAHLDGSSLSQSNSFSQYESILLVSMLHSALAWEL